MNNIKNYHEFHDAVYPKDHPQEGPRGWIQWKGTDVCMDVTCECGHQGHFDGDFFYFFECPACHKKYAVGQTVKLIPLTTDEAAFIADVHMGFKTCDLED